MINYGPESDGKGNNKGLLFFRKCTENDLPMFNIVYPIETKRSGCIPGTNTGIA